MKKIRWEKIGTEDTGPRPQWHGRRVSGSQLRRLHRRLPPPCPHPRELVVPAAYTGAFGGFSLPVCDLLTLARRRMPLSAQCASSFLFLETKGTWINGLFHFKASSEQTAKCPRLTPCGAVCNFRAVTVSFKRAGTHVPLEPWAGTRSPLSGRTPQSP